MEIWDKIRKRWNHEGEDGAEEELRIEAQMAEPNAEEAALPLDALETPEGPPERRTSDEMIETMLESVTAREQGGAAGGPAAETAGTPTEETAQSRAEEDVPSPAAADTGWEFQTWQTEEEPFEEAETDPADDEEDDFGDALF